MSKETYNYKRAALKAAKDFHYPQCVIDAIKNADDDTAIGNIMKSAREKYL